MTNIHRPFLAALPLLLAAAACSSPLEPVDIAGTYVLDETRQVKPYSANVRTELEFLSVTLEGGFISRVAHYRDTGLASDQVTHRMEVTEGSFRIEGRRLVTASHVCIVGPCDQLPSGVEYQLLGDLLVESGPSATVTLARRMVLHRFSHISANVFPSPSL